MLQTIDGIEYKMKSSFDMSFIAKYGKVFKVFDDQDSGNICFGVKNENDKYFVKFAGAPTAEYDGSASDAVVRLKQTVPIYNDLKHENLIEYLFSEEIGNGFAIVFRWVDAVCMGKQYPEQRAKFDTLSDVVKLKIFDAVLSFHLYVTRCGYVAIDFYDGSILYDFTAQKPYICDIDFYRKQPVSNDMGRMWGSTRFMSPEEFTFGAPIDEITNVYLMGAVAFALFGGETDRSLLKWRLTDSLYGIALKAVSDNRADRFATISDFIAEWNTAK